LNRDGIGLIHSIINEIAVPMITTQRMSTFISRATRAPPVRRKRGKFQGISKENRIVMVRRSPTNEHNIPVITLKKCDELLNLSK
jgi:hypothetical protein